jgi:hypothetical protein
MKERKELQKILEKELWVFGDEYATLVSDKGLDEVFNRHLAVNQGWVFQALRSAAEAVRMLPSGTRL